MEHFKTSKDHEDKLLEHIVTAYVSCIDDMIKLMTEKGIKTIVPVLTEVKNSYGPLVSPSQTIQLKLPRIDLTTDKDQEVRSQ